VKYNQLGRTGLTVSAICLGMMSFGSTAWQSWMRDVREAEGLVRRALDSGINFFDTADFYSLGESEIALGRAVSRLTDRSKVVISTKVGLPLHGGPNGVGLSRKHIIEGLDASLRRLGTEYVDLYLLHGPDPHTPIEETLLALDDVVRAGKALYIGASNFPAWQLALAERAIGTHGWRPLDVVQVQYNLLYREEERDVLPYALHGGLGVMVYSPLARGTLARVGGISSASDLRRAAQDGKASAMYGAPDPLITDLLERASDGLGVPAARIAMAWVLSRPGVTSALSGALEAGHLDDAVAAVALDIPPEILVEFDTAYSPRSVLDPELEIAGGSSISSDGWWHRTGGDQAEEEPR
jgi:aryl-alcohol dehydrogenase-like predicted oxidoreductase